MNGGERIGPVNAEAARPNLTPTPVPSEADPGTGERECGCPPDAPCTIEEDYATLAEEEAVEALAEELHRLTFPTHPDCVPRPTEMAAARRVLASDWLASHDAATADRVRRETAEGIAAAINQAARRTFTNEQEAAMRDAARIAREAGR